jgi:hypothetical protein
MALPPETFWTSRRNREIRIRTTLFKPYPLTLEVPYPFCSRNGLDRQTKRDIHPDKSKKGQPGGGELQFDPVEKGNSAVAAAASTVEAVIENSLFSILKQDSYETHPAR